MELKLLTLAADGMHISHILRTISVILLHQRKTPSLQEDFSKILPINTMMLELLVVTLEMQVLMIVKSYSRAANGFISVLIYIPILQLYENTYHPISR